MNDIVKQVQEILDERDALLEAVSALHYRHKKAMSILKDEPDATEAVTRAWEILNGDGR